MKISAKLLCMAESEIAAMVGADKIAQIKLTDKSPMIKAYVVGHEGEARGNLIGVGNIVKQWFGEAIVKLFNKLNTGLKLFHGHAYDSNDNSGRIPIGEVVGKKLLNIKDRISSVVACYIYPDFRNLPLDVASIEADIDLRGDSKDSLYVADVNEISGIALGNSEVETPGFPGATLLGQLQAFAEKKNKITLFEGDNMTLAELKQAIQEGKFQPTDLFGRDAIFADPLISEQVREKISSATGYNYRKLETLAEENSALKKKTEEDGTKLKEHEAEVKTLKLETAKSKVDSLFETQKTERKFSEPQTKYVLNRIKRFTPENADDVEKDFNTWLDTQVDDYKKDAEALGIKIDAGNDPPKVDDVTGPINKTEPQTDNKYLDPAQNPMINVGAE